ncbi:MAG: hypothetical protein ACYSTS_15925 [Planctomycetota bacterium]|jgi:hypothetical protein
MYKILLAILMFFLAFSTVKVRGGEPGDALAEQEKEKSELAQLLAKVDNDYKAVEAITGYYEYKKKHWKLLRESGENILEVTKLIRKKYSRPDDQRYEKLMKQMEDAAKELIKIANNTDKEGAVEDAQWQVRQLQKTCSLCHKHLDIHIYPQLYEKKSSKE